MSGLPARWKMVPLASLNGSGGLMTDGDWIETKDQDPRGKVRLIQLADIGDGVFLDKSSRFLTKAKAVELGCTFLEPGDVLIARMPDPLGRACIFPGVGCQAITAVDVCIWRPGENAANPEWLKYFINSPQIRAQVALLAGGTTRQRISGGNLKKLEVPTPPHSAQRGIVAKLDSLFNRSKSAREELARVLRLVERYKEAILRAAYNEAAIAAKGLTTLGAVAQEIRNGVSKRPENAPPGIPVLKISAVRSMAVRLDERRYYVMEAGEDVSHYALRVGDLLFTRYNGNPDLVANCGMVHALDEQLIYPDKLIRVRVDRQLADPEFIEAVSAAPQARAALAPSIKSAAGQHGISGADLKRLPIPLPSMDQQQWIITRIRRAFSAIGGLNGESSRAASLLDRLDQATLAKAFRGDL